MKGPREGFFGKGRGRSFRRVEGPQTGRQHPTRGKQFGQAVDVCSQPAGRRNVCVWGGGGGGCVCVCVCVCV